MYCPYCGAPVGDNDVTCNQCQSDLSAFAVPPKSDAQQPAQQAPTQTAQNSQENGAQGQPLYPPYGYPPYGGQPPYGYPTRPVQGAKCPHCGAFVEYGAPYCFACQKQISWMKPTKQPTEKDSNIFAILGFIASMVALFSAIIYVLWSLIPGFGVVSTFWEIGGVVAIIFGIIGLSNCKNCKGKGRKLSLMAIIFGGLALLSGVGIDVILAMTASGGYGGGALDILAFF